MRVLVFAPHNDDEVLGLGGTIAKMAQMGHEITVCEATSGDLNSDIVKQIKSEALQAHRILGVAHSIFLDLPVVGLKDMATKEINAAFLKVVLEVKPEIAFIPHKGDMHADHRAVADSCMVALRPASCDSIKEIYAYETLSETEWNTPTLDNAFIPNVFSDISVFMDIKIKAMNCYQTQLREFPHPRSIKAIEALATYRGSTVCVPYAEAFACLRKVL